MPAPHAAAAAAGAQLQLGQVGRLLGGRRMVGVGVVVVGASDADAHRPHGLGAVDLGGEGLGGEGRGLEELAANW